MEPCPRCGTFAPLQSNGFRSLCTPCWALVPRFDLRGANTGEMVLGLAKLMAGSWRPIVLVTLVPTVLLAALSWSAEPSRAFSLGWNLLVGSFAEALLLSVIVEAQLVGAPSWSAASRRASTRYLSVLGVNVITNLIATGAMALLCVPAIPVYAVFWPAIPIALLEARNPFRAVREGVRRAWPRFWPFALVAAVTLVLQFVPGVSRGFVSGVARGLQRPVPEGVTFGLRIGGLFFSAAVHAFSRVFQLVAWSVTRPPSP